MTQDEFRAYVVECVRQIAFGENLTDDEFLAVCKAIGMMQPEALLAMIDSDDEPEEFVRKMEHSGH